MQGLRHPPTRIQEWIFTVRVVQLSICGHVFIRLGEELELLGKRLYHLGDRQHQRLDKLIEVYNQPQPNRIIYKRGEGDGVYDPTE